MISTILSLGPKDYEEEEDDSGPETQPDLGNPRVVDSLLGEDTMEMDDTQPRDRRTARTESVSSRATGPMGVPSAYEATKKARVARQTIMRLDGSRAEAVNTGSFLLDEDDRLEGAHN